jgi:hypothetical protein
MSNSAATVTQNHSQPRQADAGRVQDGVHQRGERQEDDPEQRHEPRVEGGAVPAAGSRT